VLKVVIDCNVWVSALLGSGTPRKITDLFESAAFDVVYSAELLDELVDVLNRPKFKQRITERQIEQLMDSFQYKAVFIELENNIAAVSRDPDDDPYLACAKKGDCDFLITGDEDLLVLAVYGRTKIVTPAYFVQYLISTP
jgi:putative PIN family toxin of toxin-antitoxin system